MYNRVLSRKLVSINRILQNERSTINIQKMSYHLPVMKQECCDYLNITSCGVYVDCTLGAGGHSREILKRGGNVIGFDQDPDAIAKASSDLCEYIANGRLEIIQSNFRCIESCLKMSVSSKGLPVDGVLMDLGVSSHQIDEPTRGFSFSRDGPLDMRMNNSNTTQQQNALRIVNEYDVTALSDILYHYGDEQRSRQIAREIVCSRPLHTTKQLEEVITRLTSFKERSKTLARCFQALRIVVNDEMGALDEALSAMHRVIKPGGRLVILSYHSLEDRKVKHLFKNSQFTEAAQPPRINSNKNNHNTWKVLTKKAITASDSELLLNSRARSAKLRVAERT